MTLIDVAEFRSAIAEMIRVLSPGGSLLVANLTGLHSAGMRAGWQIGGDGVPIHFALDDYASEWAAWVEWSGIRIRNWHRPLSAYMQAYLAGGLVLAHFDEPQPTDRFPDPLGKYPRAPWFNVMEWRKPPDRS